VSTEEGWCLAIERRAAVRGVGGAQYEDDVLVGPDGAELLTTLASGVYGSRGRGETRRERSALGH
jgi:hypothetical protein